ncbi:MAG TPA: glycoside hydrolase family 38 C-terminal domain-containing protein, partial [Acidimicrobiales bacterium]|nr:glycoside hydrolase family 38 C-terminal domain-containing protein [Acidimicrobiales bacterium]
EAGRLVMGPWYILMDEFGVSGETIVRNLARGIDRAEDFGGAMDVGYLPDMFGHIAQMPQILERFGFRDTVVWRGVPESCTSSASFAWTAPNGSSVVAQFLPRGYGNGVGLPPDAASLVRRVELFCAQTQKASGGDGDPVLWMHGTDHRHPIPALPAMIAEANAAQDDWHFEISTLPAYIAAQRARTEPGATWTGELRSGARANLLMGVASNRVDVKQAAARAERGIERIAEPLTALFRSAADWPTAFLDQAWRQMLLNSAHDSICACSHDDVVLAVRDRFAEAEAIAEGLTERAKIAAYLHAAPAIDHAAPMSAVIMNPSARRRSGLVELSVPPGAQLEGAQELWEFPARLPFVTRPASLAQEWVEVVVDQIGDVHDATVTRTAEGADVDFLVDPRRFGLFDPTEVLAELGQIADRSPDASVRFFYVGTGEHHVLAHVDDVPGFGWSIWEPAPVGGAVSVDDDGRGMTNGAVTVRVADDGSFAINGHEGLGLLVDDGDRGDTYNFCAVGDGAGIEGLDDVSVVVTESGPLRARLAVTGTARWPERAFGDSRVGEVATKVETELELQVGQRVVHVTVAFDNMSRDHRLRAHFPLPSPAEQSEAECAFAVVTRGLDAEGGPSEPALATYPSRRFVSAGGLSVVHEGLCEYELVDIDGADDDRAAHTLAVTLLRATGMLSAPPMPSRPLPAGPFDPAEAAQLQGPLKMRYAVHVGDADPYELVDEAFLPLVVAGTGTAGDTVDERVPGDSDAPRAASMLAVSGAEVSALYRLQDDPDVLVLRLFNPSSTSVTVTVDGRTGILVDLRGDGDEPFDGRYELDPWAIQTIHLDPEPAVR